MEGVSGVEGDSGVVDGMTPGAGDPGIVMTAGPEEAGTGIGTSVPLEG